MIDRFIFNKKELTSFVLMFLMVMSSSFPSYDYFNLFKVLLLGFSFYIVMKYFDFRMLVSEKKILFYFAYSIFLLFFFLRDYDSFSLRIVFNLIVTVCCTAAAISVGLYRRHFLFLIPVVILFVIYNYFFNVNFYDGKPQVHAQIFTLVVLSIAIHGFDKSRFSNIALLVFTGFSEVRSVLLGLFPITILNVSRTSEHYRGYINFISVSCACFVFYYIYSNFEELQYMFGDSLNSMSWRFYHWSNLFKDISTTQILVGDGLGHSWRTTLFFDDFYTDGINYVAAHSNYVKILSETGFTGLFAFLLLFFFCYKLSSLETKSLIVFYIGYGFYDEGVWLYSVFWTLVLISDRRINK